MKKKQRGAISVFLTIILVPCIVVSSLFVDMSRVQLSKGVATSAADLAMNSLMTHYDTDLSDWYGMIGSCQNINQFYEESEQYFIEALQSQGIKDEEITSLFGQINSYFVSGDVSDLLCITVEEEQNKDGEKKKIISDVTNGSLGESSTIMKDQIVEFMKYRAPVEIAKDIIARLQSSGGESLTEADKNEELIDDKKEFAEAEEELLDAADKLYDQIKKYQNLKIKQEKLTAIADRLKSYRETYREINKLIVMNLSNTSGLEVFKRPTMKLSDGDASKAKNFETDKIISDFELARDNVVEAAGDLAIQTDVYDIQWWVQIDKKINSGSTSKIDKFEAAGKRMINKYAEITEEEDWESDSTKKEFVEKVKEYQKRYLTEKGDTTSNDPYLKLVSRLETVSKDNKNNIDSSTLKMTNQKTIGTTVSEISSQLTSDYDTLEEGRGYLKKVIEGNLMPYLKSLEDLKKLVKEYNNKFDTWKGTAQSLDTQMATEDLDEINKHPFLKDITEESITKLQNRINNIISQLTQVIDAIDSMEYGDKMIKNIDSYSTAYGRVKNKIDLQSKVKKTELENYAETLFSQVFVPYSSNKETAVFSLGHTSDSAYNPDLEKDPPALYKWMKENLSGDEKEDAKEKKKTYKEKKKESKKEEDEQEVEVEGVSGTDIYKNKEYDKKLFPSGLDKQKSFALGKNVLTGVAGLVSSLLKGNITDIRDDIYSTQYVMDMFSYSTYSNEGKYKLLSDEKKKSVTEKNYKSKSYYGGITGNAKTEGSWLSEEPYDSYNKTLTNKMINSDYNVAYGAEVEYILYGNTNKKSINAAYTDIFAIRYILNTVSGFQNFWIPDKTTTGQAIDTMATIISGATGGVVPAIAIKTVAILLLTALETAKDLTRLEKGFQVTLYKSAEDWICSLPEGKEDWDFSGEGASAGSDVGGLFYSDYLYLFVCLGFQGESASEMYLRVGDVIQANMIKKLDDKKYTLKKAKTYFTIDAKLRVDPLMLALPMATNYISDPTATTDWCTFKIAEIRGYS